MYRLIKMSSQGYFNRRYFNNWESWNIPGSLDYDCVKAELYAVVGSIYYYLLYVLSSGHAILHNFIFVKLLSTFIHILYYKIPLSLSAPGLGRRISLDLTECNMNIYQFFL